MPSTCAPLNDRIDQSEIRFLVEKNADGILVIDLNGTVLYANPAAANIFGRAKETIVGTQLGLPLVVEETSEIAIRQPGGAQIAAEIRMVQTTWEHAPALLATVRDISARRALEERMRHATKMEAVGRLTAGVAHDFNNLLTVVIGNLDQALRRFEDPAVLRCLEHAMKGARRASALTERLLAFARRKPLEPRLINANALVDGMSNLWGRTLGEGVAVTTRLDPMLAHVEVDPTELEAAILNLAVNARDAMPFGGELVIETCNFDMDRALAAEAEVQPGPHVLISVSDSGTGMAKDVIQNA